MEGDMEGDFEGGMPLLITVFKAIANSVSWVAGLCQLY